jgi:hypothetical protein
MEVAGMALAVFGYALFYTGASNLFTNGQGWGFLQSLLNKGEANNSGAKSDSGKTSSKSGTGNTFLDLFGVQGNSVIGELGKLF